MTQTPEQLAAELYDISVPDWDGEMDFYQELMREAKVHGQSILEVACGTGRVSIRLAEEGARVVGTDLDAAMLEVARRSSESTKQIAIVITRWEERGKMKSV